MPSSDPRNYARFIQKEELGQVSHWRFSAVGSAYSPDQLDAQQAEAEQVRKQLLLAREGSFADGLAQGTALAQVEAQRLCDVYIEAQGHAAAEQTALHMQALVSALQQGLQQSEQALADGIIELSCAIARQVVRHELAVNPQSVRHVVEEALGLLTSDGKPATIRLNPEALVLLEGPLRQAFSGQALAFVPDVSLGLSDCRVDSAGASMDGSLERRWERALSGLGLAAPMAMTDATSVSLPVASTATTDVFDEYASS